MEHHAQGYCFFEYTRMKEIVSSHEGGSLYGFYEQSET